MDKRPGAGASLGRRPLRGLLPNLELAIDKRLGLMRIVRRRTGNNRLTIEILKGGDHPSGFISMALEYFVDSASSSSVCSISSI